jgi:redox-regulated HSP33 family molecular chaperone
MKPPAATRLGFALMASLMVGPALTTAQQVTPLSKRTVAVTATYTGRGAVDDAVVVYNETGAIKITFNDSRRFGR